MNDHTSPDIAALKAKLGSFSKDELIEELLEALMRVTELSAPARSSAESIHVHGRDYDFDLLTDLVQRFSAALLEKLKAAEVKYGHNSGWTRDDWEADCQRHLNNHLAKGDPRDVAAYCAFLWHHGWRTVALAQAAPDLAMRNALIGLNDAIDLYWNEGRTEGQVKNICYWQFKAKEALAISSTESK